MKYFIGILFFTLSGCAIPKQSSQKKLINIEHTSCLGKCPAYTLSILSNSTVEYYGINNVKEKGRRVIKLENGDSQRIITEFEKLPFHSYKSSTTIRDIPMIIITYNNKTLKFTKGEIPLELNSWIKQTEDQLGIIY